MPRQRAINGYSMSAPRGIVAAVALGLVIASVAADATDDSREDRWAEEILPSIVVGDPVWLGTPSRKRVLALLTVPATAPKGAVIIVHGLGVHPDFGMIGGLRSRLADAGYATLSVQMPVLAANTPRDNYGVTLPAAGERIAAAIMLLRARGFAKVAIVAHSFGATMVDAYLARPDAQPIAAWVPIGMLVDFTSPPREPVLDLRAADELREVTATAPLRALRLPADICSRQLAIDDADHYFEHRQSELTSAIANFLDRVFAGKC
jgi:pimeloyl-ACP methyl ester carboxylesterase